MSWLKNLFEGGRLSIKRKEGGTQVGNFIRQLANNASGGQFGNGAMKLQPGETKAEANKRLLAGLGAGLDTAQTVAATTSGNASETPKQALTKGVVLSKLNGLFIPVIILAGLGLVVYGFFKRKK
jgi:hypothetical protein